MVTIETAGGGMENVGEGIGSGITQFGGSGIWLQKAGANCGWIEWLEGSWLLPGTVAQRIGV